MAKKIHPKKSPENFSVDNFAGVRIVIAAADPTLDFGKRIQKGIDLCTFRHISLQPKETVNKRPPPPPPLTPEGYYLHITSSDVFGQLIDQYMGGSKGRTDNTIDEGYQWADPDQEYHFSKVFSNEVCRAKMVQLGVCPEQAQVSVEQIFNPSASTRIFVRECDTSMRGVHFFWTHAFPWYISADWPREKIVGHITTLPPFASAAKERNREGDDTQPVATFRNDGLPSPINGPASVKASLTRAAFHILHRPAGGSCSRPRNAPARVRRVPPCPDRPRRAAPPPTGRVRNARARSGVRTNRHRRRSGHPRRDAGR